jgi:hypothetical protein
VREYNIALANENHRLLTEHTKTMKTRIIYISGPITGIPLHNRPAFAAAAHEWRQLGYAVIDPAVNYDGASAVTHAQYMRLSIAQLLCVDAVYMLRGWAHSNGALAEHVVAQALGLDISYQ